MTDPAGRAPSAVSSRPPIREWCHGQCSCITARDCDASGPPANRRLAGRWGWGPRGSEKAISRCKECRAQQQATSHSTSYSMNVSLGIRADPPFLTSEIYRCPFGKGSLLQLANTTVVLENGHGLSNTGHLLWG